MKTLCPQLYEQGDMRAVPCSRCTVGWDSKKKACTIESGAEHFPLVPEVKIPTCPIQDRCQHQVQSDGPCVIRSRGMVCESALVEGGMTPDEAMSDPTSFNADFMMTAEEWAAEQRLLEK
jgi:hypothetical protein